MVSRWRFTHSPVIPRDEESQTECRGQSTERKKTFCTLPRQEQAALALHKDTESKEKGQDG